MEDYNGQLRLEGGAVFGKKPGHFLVMPMTELFDPPLGTALHGKLQYSDKVSLLHARRQTATGRGGLPI